MVEAGIGFARARPAHAVLLMWWLLRGKAYLKERLALVARIDATRLPYDDRVIGLIKEKRSESRLIVLATASHRIFADQIAGHLQLFDRVLATEGRINLSGSAKCDRLIQDYGRGGFDYVANAHDDLPIWAAARDAYVVNAAASVEAGAKASGNVVQTIASPDAGLMLWSQALRLHQWTKNLLIFVPLFASHQFADSILLLKGLLAYLLFCLCASSVYILNDLLDLPDDRRHPTKQRRPFASGALPIKTGLVVLSALLLIAFVTSALLMPLGFTVVLAIYYGLTLAYSISLKRVVAIDVIVLAFLYTLRPIAGSFVFDVPLTFWLLAFSVFLFLSLALMKRYAELRDVRTQGLSSKAGGRGYHAEDLEMISSLGGSSGYMSVMVLALYVQDGNTALLYTNPQALWLACPVMLYWISRVWLIAHRGQMHDDPVTFAINDRTSWAVVLMLAATFWIAL